MLALARIVIEIDRRESAERRFRKDIDVADADQFTVEIVAPLLDGEGVMDKRIGIAGFVARSMVRPTFVVGLESVIAIVKGELGAGGGRFTDAQFDDAFVVLPATPLAAVRAKARYQHTQRTTSAARFADRTK